MIMFNIGVRNNYLISLYHGKHNIIKMAVLVWNSHFYNICDYCINFSIASNSGPICRL